MRESHDRPHQRSLAVRIGVGVIIALGSLVGGRARESWELGGGGVRSLTGWDYLVAVISGLVAGAVFHVLRGFGPPSRNRHYISWILATTVAAIPVLTPDIFAGRPWTHLLLAPLFGVLVGGGWAIFSRRVSGHDF